MNDAEFVKSVHPTGESGGTPVGHQIREWPPEGPRLEYKQPLMLSTATEILETLKDLSGLGKGAEQVLVIEIKHDAHWRVWPLADKQGAGHAYSHNAAVSDVVRRVDSGGASTIETVIVRISLVLGCEGRLMMRCADCCA